MWPYLRMHFYQQGIGDFEQHLLIMKSKSLIYKYLLVNYQDSNNT